jgi:HPt (histidine-containing phosphotransfer) domain-containing protein
MATMLMRIANEVTNELARLEQSVADSDPDGAASAAHSIRGSAQMVGAVEVTDATIALEHAVREEPPSGELISAAVARLRAAWTDTRQALEAQVEADRREYHPSQER